MRSPKIGVSPPDLLSYPLFIEVSPERELSRDDGQQRRDQLCAADYAAHDADVLSKISVRFEFRAKEHSLFRLCSSFRLIGFVS